MLAVGAPAAALDSCGPTPAVRTLMQDLGDWAERPSLAAPRSRARLKSALRTYTAAGIEARLSDINELGLMSDVQLLLRVAREHLRGTPPRTRSATRAAVMRLRQAFLHKCGGSGVVETDAADYGANPDAGSEKSARRGRAQGDMQTLGFVVLLMLLLGGGLIAANFGYSILFARIYDRRSCRIVASVSFKDVAFQGVVDVLGRRGCRFTPKDLRQIAEIADRALDRQTEVRFENLHVPAFVFLKGEKAVGILFEEALTPALQQEVLARSVTASKIRKDRPAAPNLKTRAIGTPRGAYRPSGPQLERRTTTP